MRYTESCSFHSLVKHTTGEPTKMPKSYCAYRMDPFRVESPPRSYYFPSPRLALTKDEREACLSPSRPQNDTILDVVDDGHVTSPQSSIFDESWPSQTTPSSAGGDKTSSRRETLQGAPLEPPTLDEPGSVLAKYVNRFRNDPPKSREKRRNGNGEKKEEETFWWLRTPSPPVSIAERDASSEQSTPLHDDDDEKNLEARAENLLKMSDALSSSSAASSSAPRAHVSTLASSSTASTTSTKTEEVELGRKPPPQSRPRPQRGNGEDDILYRWRLRRRFETARRDVVDSPILVERMRFPVESAGRIEPDYTNPETPLNVRLVDDPRRLCPRRRQDVAVQTKSTIVDDIDDIDKDDVLRSLVERERLIIDDLRRIDRLLSN
ncbi:proline and serine-rich protein 3-like isoform X2 [Oscarella lobularis]|uniref:proline and serine-rich protein 3-like isoform X2 n=1 Tax=Oscarella lobularis TaxID=121494 RepID=UPI0033134471